jgi:hypothetical protein
LCLNLSCKLEEINCNYLNFFKEKLIDGKIMKKYSLKELIKKEIEILKTLNFKISSPNFYFFNSICISVGINQIIKFFERNSTNFSPKIEINNLIFKFITYNELICKNFSSKLKYIFKEPLVAGIICFKASILHFCDLLKDFSFIKDLEMTVNTQITLLLDNNIHLIKKTDKEAFIFFSNLTNKCKTEVK